MISIHAPHAGSDVNRIFHHLLRCVFQSTLPMRGATKNSVPRPCAGNFNPRSPCGERLGTSDKKLAELEFQSTLPMRGATGGIDMQKTLDLFQSTLPMRGATSNRRAFYAVLDISIHAPHAGSDNTTTANVSATAYFNPRSPCGERLYARLRHTADDKHFNPRSPCGERHQPQMGASCPYIFQSTLPMRGATAASKYSMLGSRHFNPRSPCGERLTARHKPNNTLVFQSTLPMRGATMNEMPSISGINISIHAPHAGSD